MDNRKPIQKLTLGRNEAFWLSFEGMEIHVNTTETGLFGVIASFGTKFRTNAKGEKEIKDLDPVVLIHRENSTIGHWAKAEVENQDIKTEVNKN
jgi:hypothetical protein